MRLRAVAESELKVKKKNTNLFTKSSKIFSKI